MRPFAWYPDYIHFRLSFTPMTTRLSDRLWRHAKAVKNRLGIHRPRTYLRQLRLRGAPGRCLPVEPATDAGTVDGVAETTGRIDPSEAALQSLRNYLERIGWFRSVAEKLAVDRDGECLPWFTYPMISFLSGRVKPEMTVFEYGSGCSTLWWSRRVAKVTSFEHSPEWFDSLKARLPDNVDYHFCELVDGGDYCKAVRAYQNCFDVIVIDGRDRINCAKNSIGALKNDGVIIWDNTDRDAYRDGYAFLIQNGFRRLDFEGIGPVGDTSWCTSIFYRSDNGLGL